MCLIFKILSREKKLVQTFKLMQKTRSFRWSSMKWKYCKIYIIQGEKVYSFLNRYTSRTRISRNSSTELFTLFRRSSSAVIPSPFILIHRDHQSCSYPHNCKKNIMCYNDIEIGLLLQTSFHAPEQLLESVIQIFQFRSLPFLPYHQSRISAQIPLNLSSSCKYFTVHLSNALSNSCTIGSRRAPFDFATTFWRQTTISRNRLDTSLCLKFVH